MKNTLITIMTLSLIFVACEKEEVVEEIDVQEVSNNVVNNRGHIGWIGYVATLQIAGFIESPQLLSGDPIGIQEYVDEHQIELAPYLSGDLISGILDGSLNVRKSGSSAEIGDETYLTFTNSDEIVISVLIFRLEG